MLFACILHSEGTEGEPKYCKHRREDKRGKKGKKPNGEKWREKKGREWKKGDNPSPALPI